MVDYVTFNIYTGSKREEVPHRILSVDFQEKDVEKKVKRENCILPIEKQIQAIFGREGYESDREKKILNPYSQQTFKYPWSRCMSHRSIFRYFQQKKRKALEPCMFITMILRTTVKAIVIQEKKEGRHVIYREVAFFFSQYQECYQEHHHNTSFLLFLEFHTTGKTRGRSHIHNSSGRNLSEREGKNSEPQVEYSATLKNLVKVQIIQEEEENDGRVVFIYMPELTVYQD